jgi:hypothetical protein
VEYDNFQAGITQRKDLAASPGVAMEVTRKGEADGSGHRRRSKKMPTPEGWASKRKRSGQLWPSAWFVALWPSAWFVALWPSAWFVALWPSAWFVALWPSAWFVASTGDVHPTSASVHTTAVAINNDFMVFMVLAEYELK